MLERLSEGHRQRDMAEEFIAGWKPWESGIENCDERGYEVITNTKRFLDAWQNKRWDIVGKEFGLFSEPPSDNQLAGEARELYQEYDLTDYELQHIRANAAAVQIVDAKLVINGQAKIAQLRWILVNPDTLQVGLPGQGGVWKLCPYGPLAFVQEIRPLTDNTCNYL